MKIAIGDLRHNTIGRHSVFMPIGIGYIASYLLSIVDSEVEVRLYDDPDEILNDIEKWIPDVVALSNYSWNAELSKIVFLNAKKNIPKVICVSGGPEFPIEDNEARQYLLERKEIDFYIYREGEVAFANLIKKILKNKKLDSLKAQVHEGIMYVHPESSKLIKGDPLPRLANLDEIPSPYLRGLMDKWFNGYSAPSLETARGCPFTCGFCYASHSWYAQVAKFSIDRIKDELSYIAKRMQKYPNVLLSICDSNFGLTERDEEIAKHIRTLQDKYGWPNAFDVTTAKANYDRILRIASILKDRMRVSCSLQTLNPATLNVIKRKNLPMDEYKSLQDKIKKRGMISVAELIMPLPEETKDSFLKGVNNLFNAGVEFLTPYTTMLLKGTPLASEEYRTKYGLKTKFRIIPRQFGEYKGDKCFEIEEVCVSTNTLSFEDYIESRGFAFISAVLTSEQFDIIFKHIKELKINTYDYLYSIWRRVKLDKNELSKIYYHYLEETKSELFNSKKDMFDKFSKTENYDKLWELAQVLRLQAYFFQFLLLWQCQFWPLYTFSAILRFPVLQDIFFLLVYLMLFPIFEYL